MPMDHHAGVEHYAHVGAAHAAAAGAEAKKAGLRARLRPTRATP